MKWVHYIYCHTSPLFSILTLCFPPLSLYLPSIHFITHLFTSSFIHLSFYLLIPTFLLSFFNFLSFCTYFFLCFQLHSPCIVLPDNPVFCGVCFSCHEVISDQWKIWRSKECVSSQQQVLESLSSNTFSLWNVKCPFQCTLYTITIL
jgi:hypothetical protein